MASTFDLGRFRDLAFGSRALPDHPLQEAADAERMLAELPADNPEAALADITNWVATMNATDSFTPGRRARILMILDDASRLRWRELVRRYLAPHGEPLEGKNGDINILKALFDSASEVANGFAIVLDPNAGERDSKWVTENLALISLRNMRWLARRLALSHMLHLSSVGAIWERLHRLQALSEERKVARSVLPVWEGDQFKSSVKQEYARLMLFELASPDSMRARDVELTFRIAGRVAPAVRLLDQPEDDAPFAVVPAGDARPGPSAKFGPNVQPAPIYIGTLNCLPRLRAALERDMGRDPKDRDTLFGQEFTLRERNALLNRLLENWGADAPRRRGRRVALASAARVVSGYDNIAKLIPALEKSAGSEPARDLQLSIDETTRTLKRAQLRAAQQVGPARVVDASNGGLGLAIRRKDAPWARHGELIAMMIEPSHDWILGVLRRVFSVEEELRLGVQILARQPRVLSLSTETIKRDEVWEDAMKFEATFKERYRKGLLLAPQTLPIAAAEMLLPPGLASRGTQFDLPLPGKPQRIRVMRVLDEGESYQRVLFEPLAG